MATVTPGYFISPEHPALYHIMYSMSIHFFSNHNMTPIRCFQPPLSSSAYGLLSVVYCSIVPRLVVSVCLVEFSLASLNGDFSNKTVYY